MDKKLFVFDMDGTLLNVEREIIKENIAILKKASELGHHVMIATGRNYCQLDKELKLLPFIRYVATINGGILTDTKTNKTEITSKPLDKGLIDFFVTKAQAMKREFQWSNEENFYRVYFGNDPRIDIDDRDFFVGGSKDPIYQNFDECKHTLNQPVLHMAIKCERKLLKDEITHIRQTVEPLNNCTITETSKCYIDCDPLNINKYEAIKKVQKLLGVSNANTFAFGDSNNDRSMIENCGTGIAMGNARDEIKAIADVVIETHNHPGIANYVRKIILDNE